MRNLKVLSIPLLVMLAATTPASTQTRAGGAAAQQEQKVLPPEARYWVGATTLGGMTAMGGGHGPWRPAVDGGHDETRERRHPHRGP